MPPPGSEPLHFANRYSKTLPQQFAICLWRNRQAYWCVPFLVIRWSLLTMLHSHASDDIDRRPVVVGSGTWG